MATNARTALVDQDAQFRGDERTQALPIFVHFPTMAVMLVPIDGALALSITASKLLCASPCGGQSHRDGVAAAPCGAQ